MITKINMSKFSNLLGNKEAVDLTKSGNEVPDELRTDFDKFLSILEAQEASDVENISVDEILDLLSKFEQLTQYLKVDSSFNEKLIKNLRKKSFVPTDKKRIL